MNRLVERMQRLRARGERGLAPYVTAGDGGLDGTRSVLHALERGGATCVELGLPFSDPIADGPALQAAAARALAEGTTLPGTLDMVRAFRAEGGRMPVLLFGYANPFVRLGWEQAAREAAAAGVDGLLVPDVPLEELGPLRKATAATDLCCIPFVAPTSGAARVARAAAAATGFLYAIARVGVTGRATHLDGATRELVARVRAATDLPLALGFGIRTPDQVARAVELADLAVVGSALVESLHEALRDSPGGSAPSPGPERVRPREERLAERAAQVLEELSRGLRAGAPQRGGRVHRAFAEGPERSLERTGDDDGS